MNLIFITSKKTNKFTASQTQILDENNIGVKLWTKKVGIQLCYFQQ